MGLFTCHHWNSDIDTNDKKSGHQVNDVIQETFCSVDCSIEYLVHNSQKIAVDQYGSLPLSNENLNEFIEAFSNEGVEDDVLEHIKAELC